jgi:membrane protease YdiL (CAAX protease family)
MRSGSLKRALLVFGLANALLAIGVSLLLAWTMELELRSWSAYADQDAPRVWSQFSGSVDAAGRWSCAWNPERESGKSRGVVTCRISTGIGQDQVDDQAVLSSWPGRVDQASATREWSAANDLEAAPDPVMLWCAVFFTLIVAACLASQIDFRGELKRVSSLKAWFPVAAGVVVSFSVTLIAHVAGADPVEQRRFWEWGVAAWVLVIAALPLAEELNFRGVLYGALAHRVPLWQQAALNSLLFAGAHALVLWELGGGAASLLAASGLLMAGLYFFWVRHRSGSVVLTWVAHSILNAMALIYMSLVADKVA